MRLKVAIAAAVLMLACSGKLYGQNIAVTHTTVTIPSQAPPANTVNPACVGSTTAPHCFIATWTAPTTHTDGTAITGALTYDLLRATVTNGVVGSFTAVLSGISGTGAEDDTVVGGVTYEYEVIAHEAANSNPSAPSATSAAVVVPQAAPNPTSAPTGSAH
jgi:hypothetical protein